MIIKCGQNDDEKIFSYIGNDYPFCLYLYLDLKKYGANSTTIDVYIQKEKNTVSAVLLRYYSCLHVFSKDNSFNAIELGQFVEKNDLSMIYCATKTAEWIYASLPFAVKEHSSITTGWVAQIKTVDKEPQGLSVPAQKSDFNQIARLIYEDEDIGRSYKFDELARQLEERRQEGYARNLVIKKGNLVLAHACTNAELGNIAIVSELLVRREYRNKGYASEIWREICTELLSEGKEVFSFYYSEESRSLHKRIGFFEICDWSKIVIDRDGKG